MNSSPKTTWCGVLALIGGTVAAFNFHPLATKIGQCLAAIAGGCIGIFARDHSNDSSAASPPPSTTRGGLPGALVFLGFASALLFSGCGTLSPDGPYKKDKLLYEADVTITTSYQVLRQFVTWEYNNREGLRGTPEIKAAADGVRANSKGWIASAIKIREAYAAAPTTENAQALTKAIGVLRAALTEATRYLSHFDNSAPMRGPPLPQ